ncbi:nucleotide pyrophosphohydrolase [Pigmentiphaga aceris]|uniref:Nucleotide pyrophosphohydrolase n=1 Tax=Pigmentiphaga aceris TaxID=1940612 RepID=A0A5C0B2T6_9BURK|nr:nucleotide pyrophosphohydrolase [Pigmentiphaga aceris]QEI08575.1 nucleotide pyrophosphohydrolase [Pigmentiphaga aceris]
MSDFQTIQQALRRFTDERDWAQFHSPKNLAMALAGETGELVANFQWLTEAQSAAPDAATKQAIREEIADVQMYLLLLADKLDIDVAQAVAEKMEMNARKYPAPEFSGSARKYDRPAD